MIGRIQESEVVLVIAFQSVSGPLGITLTVSPSGNGRGTGRSVRLGLPVLRAHASSKSAANCDAHGPASSTDVSRQGPRCDFPRYSSPTLIPPVNTVIPSTRTIFRWS